jgi:hypothetical protein
MEVPSDDAERPAGGGRYDRAGGFLPRITGGWPALQPEA